MPKVKKSTTPKAVRTMLSVQAIPDVANIRTSTLFDQDHTVIPCIALLEGVLWPANAPGPELALAEEFGRFPDGWNGRPVVFGHPFVDGEPVSASTPDVLEVNAFGQLFNTVLEGKKLKTEIWINEALISNLSEEAQETIENLKTGKGIAEVSTGLFVMSESTEGIFDGEEYTSIWRNIVPDHLAVLPEGVAGACSVEDGCGAPRSNQMVPAMRAAQLNVAADISADGIDDDTDEEIGIFQRLLLKAGGILNFRDSAQNLSDSDLRTALNAALKTVEPDKYFFILAVHSSTGAKGTFVYEVGFDGTLFQRTFNVTSNGMIKIGSEATSVRPITTFVPVEVTTNQNLEDTMNVEERVNALIANESTQFGEDDREWLSTLEEDRLSSMVPLEAVALDVDVDDVDDKPISTKDYVAAAPADVQHVLNSSLQMHKERKEAVITALRGNPRCKFSQEDLEAKDIPELENMAALAVDISYEGAGANLTLNQDGEDIVPAPPVIFAAPKADAA